MARALFARQISICLFPEYSLNNVKEQAYKKKRGKKKGNVHAHKQFVLGTVKYNYTIIRIGLEEAKKTLPFLLLIIIIRTLEEVLRISSSNVALWRPYRP